MSIHLSDPLLIANLLLIFAIVAVLMLALVILSGLRRRFSESLRRRRQHLELSDDLMMKSYRRRRTYRRQTYSDEVLDELAELDELDVDDDFWKSPWYAHYISRLYDIERRRRRTRAIFIILNILTTVVALIPLGFAIYDLFTNNQQQALYFNLASLCTAIAAKVGLFLLASFIPSMLQAVPGAIAGAILARAYNDWRDKQKHERQ